MTVHLDCRDVIDVGAQSEPGSDKIVFNPALLVEALAGIVQPGS